MGGHDQKGLLEGGGDPVHSDLPLLHGLQQGGLGAGSGPVDLVGQHHIGQQGAGPVLELPGLLVIEVDARQVRGQQVRGELDALEVPADGSGKGPEEHGLAGAGDVLQQHMAGAEEAHQHQPDGVLLAHDDAGAVMYDFIAVGRGPGNICHLSALLYNDHQRIGNDISASIKCVSYRFQYF